MSNEVLKSASHGKQFGLESVVMLEEPIVELDDGAILRILAVYTDSRDGQRARLGYVSTKSGHAQMLSEFSDEPTGEYKPCNAVKGWVGENTVYDKNVSTDMPLSGLRTAIAQRRAARIVKARLK